MSFFTSHRLAFWAAGFFTVACGGLDRDEREGQRADESGPMDADAGGAADGDMAPHVVEAVVGERCSEADRVGIVSIGANGSSFHVVSSLFGQPMSPNDDTALGSDVCDFYSGPAFFCPLGCTFEEVCGEGGTCVPAPIPLEGELSITGPEAPDGEPQIVPAGGGFAEVTIPGTEFAIEVTGYPQVVRAPAMAVPDPLSDLLVNLEGDSMQPGALDISWQPDPGGAHLYTKIPINHHAAGPTFTECVVDAAAGSLHIEEEMLVPLAVITGLEFQGVEHVRFAAANTDLGCLEFRFRRAHFAFPQ